jgi:mono/diheme cytochrome c family protein
MKIERRLACFLLCSLGAWACLSGPESVRTNPAVAGERTELDAQRDDVNDHADAMLEEGRETFRYETFGSEAFWTQTRLHEAILGEKQGGVGPGLTAKGALELGLKVDILKLLKILVEVLQAGSVSLESPETTLELLRADAVVGVKAIVDEKTGDVTGIGLRCAFCHSTVDDSFAKGIGRRLDGWPNRDLDVGAIVAMAPNLRPFQDLLGVDEARVRKVLGAWGPGRYDAALDKDGKGFRPDGKTAATLIPAAFGLAGVNLHTYTGWGSVPYWNAYVATTQMHGQGTFFDPRIQKSPEQFPVGAKARLGNLRGAPDLVTAKLAALHFYELAIPAPKPSEGSYDPAAARRGQVVFEGSGRCASCHVPPLFTEPGWAMHTGEEIGIDDFQASRSPDKEFYRTTPLAGLFVRAKGGFYHDGRFADYRAVVDHYDGHLGLRLTELQKRDLVEYLKSL